METNFHFLLKTMKKSHMSQGPLALLKRTSHWLPSRSPAWGNSIYTLYLGILQLMVKLLPTLQRDLHNSLRVAGSHLWLNN